MSKQHLEKARKTLEAYATEDLARAEAWGKVQIAKKKDGTDFANLGKSFVGAKIGEYYPVEGWHNPYLTVNYGYVNENGIHVSGVDHMEIYTENEPDEYVEKRQSSFVTTAFHYVLTPDAIYEKIAKRAKDFRKSAERHKKELDALDELYNKYVPTIENLMQEMKKDTKELGTSFSDIHNSSLFFELKEAIEDIVKSCY